MRQILGTVGNIKKNRKLFIVSNLLYALTKNKNPSLVSNAPDLGNVGLISDSMYK